jgi:hypothetical protein
VAMPAFPSWPPWFVWTGRRNMSAVRWNVVLGAVWMAAGVLPAEASMVRPVRFDQWLAESDLWGLVHVTHAAEVVDPGAGGEGVPLTSMTVLDEGAGPVTYEARGKLLGDVDGGADQDAISREVRIRYVRLQGTSADWGPPFEAGQTYMMLLKHVEGSVYETFLPRYPKVAPGPPEGAEDREGTWLVLPDWRFLGYRFPKQVPMIFAGADGKVNCRDRDRVDSFVVWIRWEDLQRTAWSELTADDYAHFARLDTSCPWSEQEYDQRTAQTAVMPVLVERRLKRVEWRQGETVVASWKRVKSRLLVAEVPSKETCVHVDGRSLGCFSVFRYSRRLPKAPPRYWSVPHLVEIEGHLQLVSDSSSFAVDALRLDPKRANDLGIEPTKWKSDFGRFFAMVREARRGDSCQLTDLSIPQEFPGPLVQISPEGRSFEAWLRDRVAVKAPEFARCRQATRPNSESKSGVESDDTTSWDAGLDWLPRGCAHTVWFTESGTVAAVRSNEACASLNDEVRACLEYVFCTEAWGRPPGATTATIELR